jgi:hypothetical protein
VKLPSSVHCKSTLVGELSSCDAVAEREIWLWLRQQLTQFYALDLQKLIKQWDKCNNVGYCMEQFIVCSGNFLVYFIASVWSFFTAPCISRVHRSSGSKSTILFSNYKGQKSTKIHSKCFVNRGLLTVGYDMHNLVLSSVSC